jgi:molecular chaperone GrpE
MSHINENTNDVSQADAENDDKNLEHYDESEIETTESEQVLYKLQLNELKELLEKEKQNSSLNTEKWKRALADYQNLEKRTQQEIIDKVSSETGKLILEFLTIYENFIRAKEVYAKEGVNITGLVSIIKNMNSLFSEYGVKPIDALGKIFDPNLNEVISIVKDPKLAEDIIIEEIAKGYIIRGKVLKYSKVCVSKKTIKK